MYGTIARMKGKPGALELFRRQENQRRPAGIQGTYIFQMDADPEEFWAVVVFKDRESYQANAESPEQDREYRELRQLLLEEPEWHDGEIVFDGFQFRQKERSYVGAE
jgi:hypothetical protein